MKKNGHFKKYNSTFSNTYLHTPRDQVLYQPPLCLSASLISSQKHHLIKLWPMPGRRKKKKEEEGRLIVYPAWGAFTVMVTLIIITPPGEIIPTWKTMKLRFRKFGQLARGHTVNYKWQRWRLNPVCLVWVLCGLVSTVIQCQEGLRRSHVQVQPHMASSGTHTNSRKAQKSISGKGWTFSMQKQVHTQSRSARNR